MKINKVIVLTFLISKVSDGEFKTFRMNTKFSDGGFQTFRMNAANDTINFTEGDEMHVTYPVILLVGKTGK
jgi:hypothetical protein